jgi:multidrug efflux pump
MQKLSALSIRFPRFVAVSVLATIVWGLMALWMLPRQEEPVLTWRLANVITRWPGANPERMETLVTDPLEKAVQEVDEVAHIYSVSRAGVSLLQVELSDQVTDAGPIWQRVRQKLEQVKDSLPRGARDPQLDDEIMGTFAQLIAVVGDETSYRELKDHAERLEDEIRFLPTAASTSLFGTQEESIQVEVHPARLVAYDLTLEQIAQAIMARNTRDPAGRMTTEAAQFVIEASGEIESVAQLRQMVLSTAPSTGRGADAGGRTLRLGEVADIVRSNPDPPQPIARFNGRRAVVLGVRARSGVRMDRFGDHIARVLDSVRASLPESVSCHVAHDLAVYTRGRGSELLRTFGLAVSFVFLVTAVFMGWRGATIVTMAIPLTGLLVLVIFYAVGIPLNQMSVMAIIMAFGLLVDDAVVVTEQVHRRITKGHKTEPPESTGSSRSLSNVQRAAAEEPSKLTAPLIVSTLTTIAAFIPIYLLPGGTGEFVRAIPLGVAICLLVALFISVTVVPWCCSGLFRHDGGTREGGVAVNLRARCGSAFQQMLQVVVAHPRVTLSLVFLLATFMATFGVAIRRDFFSPVQRDQFVIDVFTRQGSAINHTSSVVAEIESELHRDELVETTTSFIGRNAPLIFYNLQSQETYAAHFAQIVVRVDHWQETSRVASRVQSALNRRISDADCVVHILEHGAPLTAPFEIRISGDAIPALREAGRRVTRVLNETPGVRNIRSNYGTDSMKLVAQVNEPVARRMGIDQRKVADQLRHRVDGLVASYFREEDELRPINVRLPAEARATVTDLDGMYFKPGDSADAIPFAAVAKLDTKWEPASIYRRDGLRTLSVLAYPQFGLTAAQVSSRFENRIRQLDRAMPEGYAVKFGGESQQRHEAEANLLGGAVYAVFPILLLLVAEFRSLRLSLLILCLVPLSLGGVMMGLFLTGWPLNFMAIMGMMMLFGWVVIKRGGLGRVG